MHLQVGVFNIERHLQALTADGTLQSRSDIQVEGIAELVGAGGTAGFDAGGHIAGVMAAEA